MRYAFGRILILCVLLGVPSVPQSVPITIDYPENHSIFPSDIIAPTFLWRGPAEKDNVWEIDVTFSDGSPALHLKSAGERMKIGEMDPRTNAPSNRPPQLTPLQAAARTWSPDAATWKTIKKHSMERPAKVTITGGQSRGEVSIVTSKDPVGAPIFYRDVPLMPSEVEKGVIKPLAPASIPLIAWRLKYVGEPGNRLMMTGLHTCANCHSFSRDGKTLGMDMDGPQNDKGMYALAQISQHMSIRNDDVIQWSSFKGKMGGKIRVGFMSQISPDGQYVVNMVNGSDAGRPSIPSAADLRSPAPERPSLRKDLEGNYYVANFKDYRFLQVFFPTRGILAWYSRATGKLQPLPGADDPRYVQTNAVWSPDGKYIVFARATAREPYPEGGKLAEFANDPNETQIQYDLYRIPFNGGQGGTPEPIAGASNNGMSNAFPKVSPDGRWIVFVQARNGLLMRPDSKLYIIPTQGGKARLMSCNTPLMNSWHSFSPNGRWLVFSSKSRSPYTKMFLTHLDANGNDSPPILVENTTASNRAVNLPEFVNIPPDGLLEIKTPATDFYRLSDSAWELTRQGKTDDAIAEWKRALDLSPEDDRANSNLALLLVAAGRFDEAVPHFETTLRVNPAYPDGHSNLGVALAGTGNSEDAIREFEKALEINPSSAEAHNDLGRALEAKGDLDKAISHFHAAREAAPDSAAVRNNLGRALVEKGRTDEALAEFQHVLRIDPKFPGIHENLGRAYARRGDFDDACTQFQLALDSNSLSPESHNGLAVALVRKGLWKEAIPHFEQAVSLRPDYIEAHFNLGDTLYYLAGRPSDALAQWREVLRLDPKHVAVLSETASLLASSPDALLRDGVQAVELAERAAQLTERRDATVLDTLAAAYAEVGRFADAIDITNRTLEFARQQNNAALSARLEARLALYRSGTPFRSKPAARPDR
jgi:tetratricopeptide (TPR) repeat protein